MRAAIQCNGYSTKLSSFGCETVDFSRLLRLRRIRARFGPQEVEGLREPFRVIRPRLCRHEITVGRDLADPRTFGGFDFGPDGRGGRHLVSVEDVRSCEDLGPLTEGWDWLVDGEELPNGVEHDIGAPEMHASEAVNGPEAMSI
jgi:hypothetical protein